MAGDSPRTGTVPTFSGRGLAPVYPVACAALRKAGADGTLGSWLKAHLSRSHRGDYVALLAYIERDKAFIDALQKMRLAVRDGKHLATCAEFGPRFLHSTGQLHKGGPNTGVFILVSATPRQDVEIPGEAFSFGTLELAQALGDFASLDATGRRALHIHLPAPDAGLLRDALALVLRGVRL